MFTSEQYRVKAAEYAKLVKTANSPDEVREFQKLERSFTELADNGNGLSTIITRRCMRRSIAEPVKN